MIARARAFAALLWPMICDAWWDAFCGLWEFSAEEYAVKRRMIRDETAAGYFPAGGGLWENVGFDPETV